MMTMHIVMTPDELPQFRHAIDIEFRGEFLVGTCITPRGKAVCACRHYKLCDPLVVACPATCACACHQGQA
jgi:hypothetical protein